MSISGVAKLVFVSSHRIVTKIGGTDVIEFKNVNNRIEQGEVVVVCGPSGSGKSTMIRCINGLEKIQEGEIVVDGIAMTHAEHNKKELVKLRTEVGMVFQQFNLYPHKTVLENVTLAPIKVRKMKKEDADELAMALLKKVHTPG